MTENKVVAATLFSEFIPFPAGFKGGPVTSSHPLNAGSAASAALLRRPLLSPKTVE